MDPRHPGGPSISPWIGDQRGLKCGITRRSHLKDVSAVSLCMGWIFQSHTLQKFSVYSDYTIICKEVATLVWVPPSQSWPFFSLIKTQVRGFEKTSGKGREDACGFLTQFISLGFSILFCLNKKPVKVLAGHWWVGVGEDAIMKLVSQCCLNIVDSYVKFLFMNISV